MGANYCTVSTPKIKEDEVREWFNEVVQDDCWSNGHEYSGTIGMATGLKFHDEVFDSEDEADDYLQQHAQKWEEAIAVRVVKPNREGYTYIGAWCSS